jgi:hypothetical protein
VRVEWMHDNHFHPESEDDWAERTERLMASRDAGVLRDRPAARRSRGGVLRRAWERKNALGPDDRSVLGVLALAIGAPVRALKRAVRRVRRLVRPAEVPVLLAPTSQRAGAEGVRTGARPDDAGTAGRSDRLGDREEQLVPGRDAG